MILSHRIELDTTFKQRRYFTQAVGCARFVWNLALAEWDRQYRAGGKPSWMQLIREFNQTKYELYPWMKDIHRDAHARPFANLDKAFRAFFKGTSKRPTFKKKGKCRDSFYVANDQFRLDGRSVVLPRIGRVRLTEMLRFAGKIMGAVVSRTAERWFISIQVDVGDYQRPRTADGEIGIDLGINSFAVTSDGDIFKAPKPLAYFLKKLARLQRSLSRKKKGSSNREKLKAKIARVYARIANIRKDYIDKLSTKLCRENQAVVIENLSVSGMLRNRKLSRAIADLGWSEFRRMLGYKSQTYGSQLITIDRWFPSSKTCSNCGRVKDLLSLSQRTFRCECGLQIDRDLNAARNILTAGLAGRACGDSGAGEPVMVRETAVCESGTKSCLNTDAS